MPTRAGCRPVLVVLSRWVGGCSRRPVPPATPDGCAPCGLWAGPFEGSQGRTVVAPGERSADLAGRLRYAEVPCTVEPDALTALIAAGRECVVIANYSAFVGLRSQLRASA